MHVFHLLTILEKVVAPDDMSTWRMRLLNAWTPSSDTRTYACAVRSLVCSLLRFQTESASEKLSVSVRTFGRMRTSNPQCEKRICGLSFE